MTLNLSMAMGRYDRTAALVDGRIRPEGVTLNWLDLNPEQVFFRMIQHSEFDVAEMALASYVILRSKGNRDMVGIPAFVSRAFRHDTLYVNTDSGISQPSDLRGKRVGVPEYQMTTAVWIRGNLEDDYGVKPEEIEWIQGSLEQPGRIIHTPVAPRGVRLSLVPAGKTLTGMLDAGEIDAILGPRMPSSFRLGSKRIRRLFDDPWSVAREYYARTKIFPIMHLVVVRASLVAQHPWLPQTLFNAFLEAKRIAEADLADPTALHTTLPFLLEERDQTIALMGSDFWSYGVDANRHVLDEYLRLSLRQDLIAKPDDVDDMFPASTRRTSRI